MRSLMILAAALGMLATAQVAEAGKLTFTTIDNPADPTFNQLLGIKHDGKIVGYYGSGAAGHPNKGYEIVPPYKQFQSLNFPGSTQTQATGISDNLVTGFWSNTNTGTDANLGFIRVNTGNGNFKFVSVDDKKVSSKPKVNQVLGINNVRIAVGFYNDVNTNSHGYAYDLIDNMFAPIDIHGAVSSAATGINNADLVCGFFVDGKKITRGYLKRLNGGSTIAFRVPGSSTTQFLGVNDKGEAVGFYVDGKNVMHGVLYNPKNGSWLTIDDPKGVGGTVLNGLNDSGQLVGFYIDSVGNFHGMLVYGAP